MFQDAYSLTCSTDLLLSETFCGLLCWTLQPQPPRCVRSGMCDIQLLCGEDVLHALARASFVLCVCVVCVCVGGCVCVCVSLNPKP